MPRFVQGSIAVLLATFLIQTAATAQDPTLESRKTEYVRAVTRGAALMPWQSPGVSEQERAFREEIERRKDALLAHSATVNHPVLYLPDSIARARAATESNERATKWLDSQLSIASYVISQPSGWIDSMIPEEAPANGYGFTCPKCVGVKSQEAVGHTLAQWSYKEPDTLKCAECGQAYPDPAFPESATLELPRLGRRIGYYLNDAERANPDDRSGKLAWHWVGHPIHVSFTGFIRERKIGFMIGAARSTAFAYAFTGDVRYAAATRDILVRYARCYRNWPYRDYWDTYADCDPMYAAWHDRSLPIEWKRHLCEDAYAKDSVEKAAMLRDFWGAGRAHPSTDGIGNLSFLCEAYDLTCTAADATGAPVWSVADRTIVERDLLLEYTMGAEPYLGGANKADIYNNKSPRVYSAMASVAKCLGITEMAVTALTGYERVRDASFNYDGFSVESPAYNNMYLGSLLDVPETLHGFVWPDAAQTGRAPVDYYTSDPKLKLMYRAVLWTLSSEGTYLPLSDTNSGAKPSVSLPQMGLRHYPDLFEGTLPALGAANMTEYALFNLEESALQKDTGLALPETCFPAWQTAVLRHGSSKTPATLALPFNPSGGHRHTDNLALFYRANGRAVLDDLGYVGDMPVNSWIHSTESHNLIVVDDAAQRAKDRIAEFSFMATSPMASVVEATSNAYAQCTEYRRRVVLIKGPDEKTFVVDLFRASGGKKHAFRICTEYAASDTADASLSVTGVTMPPEPQLPQVGASLAREDIFGLRDVRAATPDGDAWQATWRDAEGAYRMWMLSPCNRVEASNGPAQRKIKEAGRRARYLDAVREGDNLTSTYFAIHEPAADANAFPITQAIRLDVPEAGPRAVAAKIETSFGVYYVFNDFDAPGEVDGIRFQGTFAVVRIAEGAPPHALSVGATALLYHGRGLENGPAQFAGNASRQDDSHLTLATQPPATWPAVSADAQAYVRAKVNGAWTGFPLAEVAGNTLTVKDYPLPELEAAELLATCYGALE
ncbi:MAG: heparinase II/III-family protein [Candidatus Hydrogenedentes bacterium]|nr:heparinase II/III-family protein [Candidatus Hydrogenedentota bacterium]